MARRETKFRVEKTNQIRPNRTRGKGDVEYRAFECPAADCANFIVVEASQIARETFSFTCKACERIFGSGDVVKMFDWRLTEDGGTLSSGTFELGLDEYVAGSGCYKFCILCNTLRPFESFGLHSARKTGRQGECTDCKTQYNRLKNPTRTQDQHREAAQRRRLFVELGGTSHFDQQMVRSRFGDKCFACGLDVSGEGEAQFDHTLPVRFLWPMTTHNATLLCSFHNGAKGARWPSEVYSEQQLRELAVRTGLDYDLLAGQPRFNPAAIEELHDQSKVENLLARHAHYRNNLLALRNRVLLEHGYDFFTAVPYISQDWIVDANALLSSTP